MKYRQYVDCMKTIFFAIDATHPGWTQCKDCCTYMRSAQDIMRSDRPLFPHMIEDTMRCMDQIIDHLLRILKEMVGKDPWEESMERINSVEAQLKIIRANTEELPALIGLHEDGDKLIVERLKEGV